MNKKHYLKILHLINEKYPSIRISDLFSSDPRRFDTYQLTVGDIFLDFSKNKINDQIFAALIKLARDSQLVEKRDEMFQGKITNTSENLPVLHTALRNFSHTPIVVNNIEISVKIQTERQRMEDFVNSIHQGQWRGFSGKAITDIVNIGIGGSDLGPKMVVSALQPYCLDKIKVHFISNVDANSLLNTLNKINPETTLFIVASKSFKTEETLLNAGSARKWLLEHYNNNKAVRNHFVAISSALEKVENFGIDTDHCFEMWDWVGGRYSLWSSIGLVIALAIGFEHYTQLLQGAFLIDHHFQEAPLEKNMPVILAILGILYSNFYYTQSHAILAYDDRLKYLVDYFQQSDMESNGKSCCNNGKFTDTQTGVVLWGGVGTNGQHAFHQLLHQGTVEVPVDFIAVKTPHHNLLEHHQILLANCLAQSQALMQGKTKNDVLLDLEKESFNDIDLKKLAPHKIIPGNKPSNTLLLEKLTPKSLGSLIALYEHKIFTQGIIWNINSFDQWGVELGKKLSNKILQKMKTKHERSKGNEDSSTAGLIQKIKCS